MVAVVAVAQAPAHLLPTTSFKDKVPGAVDVAVADVVVEALSSCIASRKRLESRQPVIKRRQDGHKRIAPPCQEGRSARTSLSVEQLQSPPPRFFQQFQIGLPFDDRSSQHRHQWRLRLCIDPFRTSAAQVIDQV